MKVVWHLVTKDMRRLRVAVALLCFGSIGKLIFYGIVAGLFSAPDLEWLRRLQDGPEVFLRILAEPLVTYLLVGWVVFDDAPGGRDSHWITLPISGRQLFAAKLGASVLLFVILPLAIKGMWWLACGLGWPEILESAVQLCMLNLAVVSVALACASLTDGFPRFVLWSLMSVGTLFMVQIILLPGVAGSVETVSSRLIVWFIGGTIVALVLAGHQYETRRRKRTLSFAFVGLILVGGISAVWRGTLLGPDTDSESPDFRNVRLEFTGTARDEILGNGLNKKLFARVGMSITGLPHSVVIANVGVTGEWRIGGKTAWTSTGGRYGGGETAGLQTTSSERDRFDVLLSFSPKLLAQAGHEPFELRGRIRLDLFRGEIVAEFPFREAARPQGGRAYTISQLVVSSKNEQSSKQDSPDLSDQTVAIVLTERTSGNSILSTALTQKRAHRFTPVPSGSNTLHLLVNRGTGEFIIYDWTKSERVSSVSLDQTAVVCWKFVFPFRHDRAQLAEYSFVAIRFDGGETVSRESTIERLSFGEKPTTRTP